MEWYGWTNVTRVSRSSTEKGAKCVRKSFNYCEHYQYETKVLSVQTWLEHKATLSSKTPHAGTMLNSNLGKIQAASADYLSDDGEGNKYRIETNQDIVGRVFIEGVNQKCNINSTTLLRNGFFDSIWSKNCVQESVNRSKLVLAGNITTLSVSYLVRLQSVLSEVRLAGFTLKL